MKLSFTKNKDVDSEDIANKVQTFENIVGSSLVQKLIKSATVKCRKCGKNLLEVAIDYYLGKRSDICLKCRLLVPVIKTVVGNSISIFGMSEKELIDLMQDSYWTKGLVSVIKGLGEMGIEKPFVPAAPLQVQWDLTDGELSFEQIHDAIEKLANFGVAHITFIGKTDSSFIKHANDVGMYPCLISNGFDLEKIDKYVDAGVKFVDISLESISPKKHNEKFGIDNLWENAVESIKKYSENDVYVEVSTEVTQDNLLEIPQIIEFLKQLGVGWYKLDIVNGDLNDNQRLELFKLIYMENINEDMQILTNDPQLGDITSTIQCNGMNMIPTHFFNLNYDKEAMKELGNYIGSCGAGRFYMAIDGNGDIYPCDYFRNLKIANIRDDLDSMWLNNDVLLNLRNRSLLKGKCGCCESKYICGGCRKRAFMENNDYLSEDNHCLKDIKENLLN